MANTAKRLGGPVQPGTGVSTAYTVPAATTTILKSMDFCNTGTAAVSLNVYIVPSGGTASAANAMMSSLSIPNASNEGWEGEMVLNTGDTIQHSASVAASITAFYNGVELS